MKIFADMDTDQYWMSLWTMATTGVLILATIIAITSYNEDVMVTNLVREGHDPMELACLYNLSESLEASCMILAQAKAKAIENAPK